mmetsp:Transcript_11381/g.18740  ORF Transcript_11381/g.18740 Transcript_11381/m.18740 type:complete len:120 (-) Transcript_11381:150-509(-)|eukprot:scaffold3467_cov136-Skeletonema_menzelii.AAC.2
MNNTALLITVLAVLLAVVTNTATAAAELLEPLYPENYQERREEEARLARLEPAARTVEYRARLDTYRADQLRGSIEAREGGEFRATRSVSLFDQTGARRADARLDGDTGENLFGVPLPP